MERQHSILAKNADSGASLPGFQVWLGHLLGKGSETGWDHGPFAAVFAPGQTLPEQQNTGNYKGLRKLCAFAVGTNYQQ